MTVLLDTVTGQPKVREYLRTLTANNAVSHAYLFCGPAGSGKTVAAYALAQAFLCEQGGCGTCDDCMRVARRSHPDVHAYAPEGAAGYLVDQIRGIVSDVSLAPVRAKRKVYILDRVDLLGHAAANAFLKTLEEPPDATLMILLARTRESVLPTILSRCQVVPFRHVPASEAAGIVAQRTGVDAVRARIAVEACNGSIDRAEQFCRSSEQQAFRREVVQAMGQLRCADSWDLLKCSARLVEAAKAPLDEVRVQMDAQLQENAQYLARAAVRQIEAQNKRTLTARAALSLQQLCSIAASWVRDVMMICEESPQLVVNRDADLALQDAAAATNAARCARALACIQSCQQALAYNVSPQTCLDALLLELKEVLYDPDCSGTSCI